MIWLMLLPEKPVKNYMKTIEIQVLSCYRTSIKSSFLNGKRNNITVTNSRESSAEVRQTQR